LFYESFSDGVIHVLVVSVSSNDIASCSKVLKRKLMMKVMQGVLYMATPRSALLRMDFFLVPAVTAATNLVKVFKEFARLRVQTWRGLEGRLLLKRS